MQRNPIGPRTVAWMAALPFCCAALLSGAPCEAAQAQPPAREPQGARIAQVLPDSSAGASASPARLVTYRRGWYLGVAPIVTRLHQDALAPLGNPVRLVPTGAGARFLVGYAFTELFALELSALGAGFDTDRPGVDAAMAQVALDAVAHLRPGRVLQPYVVGGLGAVAVGIEGGGLPRHTVEGGLAQVGTGLELHVARHFALAADYRYSLHAFQRQVTRVDHVETRVDIDAQGHAHAWGLRCVYSF